MKTTIASGFHPAGLEQYGKAFLKTFDRYWPAEVDIVVYTEEPIKTLGRETVRDVFAIPGCKQFIDEHQDPRYHGNAEVPGWNKKDHQNGSSWRFDAVKFCRQLFIPEHAAGYLPDGDILAWFDADVVSYAEVPGGFIGHQLGDFDLVTIGRDRLNTDIGFWAVRLNHDTRMLLKDIADSYRSGFVLKLEEWHSGFLFDYWVAKYKAAGKLKHRTLTQGNGHVWFKCDIGRYTDHLKGPMRKQLGYSPERNGMPIKAMFPVQSPKK